MKQLTLFDMDDYRLKCPYCGSELIAVYTGDWVTRTFCYECNTTLREEATIDVQYQPST